MAKKIFISAKPGAREEKIEKIGESEFKISVKEPPVGGRANWAIIRVLSGYFKAPLAKIRIVSGATSRRKIIEIED